MASTVFQDEPLLMLITLRQTVGALVERYKKEGKVMHITSILRDPRDGSLSFLVWFSDDLEESMGREIQQVINEVRTRAERVEAVNQRWFLAQGRPECA